METNNLFDFIKDFNIVDNALNMRTLRRWNGRDLRREENLAEHTHLVAACVVDIFNTLKFKTNITAEQELSAMKLALLHDSLELFRGDILSCTKDSIPGLRTAVDNEENYFLRNMCDKYKIQCNDKFVQCTVRLADLYACCKFIEKELEYPTNDFTKEAFLSTTKKYKDALAEYVEEYCIQDDVTVPEYPVRFQKGYELDAGVDIILDDDVTFMPHSTKVVDLNVKYTPEPCEMAVLCARTSAAKRGLNVAMCPIDTDYVGMVRAIVHNISNEIITYKKGEAFCQLVPIVLAENRAAYEVKKRGKRTDSTFGGTDK